MECDVPPVRWEIIGRSSYLAKTSTILKKQNVGKTMPWTTHLGMVYTTHLWWFGGWFIVVLPTLFNTSVDFCRRGLVYNLRPGNSKLSMMRSPQFQGLDPLEDLQLCVSWCSWFPFSVNIPATLFSWKPSCSQIFGLNDWYFANLPKRDPLD